MSRRKQNNPDSPTPLYCIRCGRSFLSDEPEVPLCPICQEELGMQVLSGIPASSSGGEDLLEGGETADEGIPTLVDMPLSGASAAEGVPPEEEGISTLVDIPPARAEEIPTLPDLRPILPEEGIPTLVDTGIPGVPPEPVRWQVGDVVLDLYRVTDVFETGGMGLVYRVHHLGWNIDMVMKSPRVEFFRTAALRDSFLREAETWVNLGLHPNIVTCYYVRLVKDIPHIFAEYVAGGTLADWIRTCRLTSLDRMLDVAIQFARGLGYAHDQGLVHQDVKPGNVMMTPDGVARVTDFGLARARAAAGGIEEHAAVQNIRASTGLMTPAYCSPEQASGGPLTHRTDIWSWGVSILEMFVGDVKWLSGQVAAEALTAYLEMGPTRPTIPPMPAGVAELLRQCFQLNPDDRPRSMDEIAAALEAVYREEIGQPYPRQQPGPAELRADSLNNRALSLLDLGRQQEAEIAWEAALEADPHHAGATYNLGLWRWRTGQQPDDLVLVSQVEAVANAQPHDWQPRYLLGLVHLERGDGMAAEAALREAQRLAPDEESVGEALARVEQVRAIGCLHAMEDHTGCVNTLALTPDGRCAVSGSYSDRTLRLWDLHNGRCLRVMEGHERGVHMVAVTPDGRYALSASDDMTVRLWDLQSGACARVLTGHQNTVRVVTVSEDGAFALSGGGMDLSVSGMLGISSVADNSLRLWEISPGRCLRVFEGHEEPIHAAAFIPNHRLAISASRDRTLRVWDLANGACIHVLKGHAEPVNAVSITPDGLRALSASDDKTLRLWDLRSGRCVHVFREHESRVHSLAFTPDARQAVSCDWSDEMRLWDVVTGECLRVLEGWPHLTIPFNPSPARAVAITPDGAYAVAGSNNGTVRLWDLQTGCCVRSFTGHRNGVYAIAITPDGRRAISGSQDNTLRVWQWENIGQVRGDWSISRPTATVQAIGDAAAVEEAISAARQALDAGRFAEAGEAIRQARRVPGYERDHVLLNLWHQAGVQAGWRTGISGGRCLFTFDCRDRVTAVAITPDGSCLLAGCANGKIYQHDNPEFRLDEVNLRLLREHTARISDLAVTPDGQFAVSASSDKTLCLWYLADGRYVRTFTGHSEEVTTVAVSPDGRRILSASYTSERGSGIVLSGRHTGELRLWDLQSGECLRTFEGHANIVREVVISPDGRLAVSGAFDNQLLVWDMASGQSYSIPAGEQGISALAIMPNGRFVVAAGFNRAVNVWDISEGRRVGGMAAPDLMVSSLALSPDEQFAVLAVRESIQVWRLQHGREDRLCVLEGHRGEISSIAMSADGCYLVSGGEDNTLRLWALDWDYEFPAQADWDDRALPYLEVFLNRHTPESRQRERRVRSSPTDLDTSEWERLADRLREPGLPGLQISVGTPRSPAQLGEDELEQLAERLRRGYSGLPTHEEATEQAAPAWTEEDFQQLLVELRYRGYGWLRPEGVRRKLEELAAQRGR